MRAMTEKQKELAARKLCLLRGVDPEESRMVWDYDPDPEPTFIEFELTHFPELQVKSRPAWKFALWEIETQEQLEIAMETGRLGEP